jgi:hypothetical protein
VAQIDGTGSAGRRQAEAERRDGKAGRPEQAWRQGHGRAPGDGVTDRLIPEMFSCGLGLATVFAAAIRKAESRTFVIGLGEVVAAEVRKAV